MNRRQQAFADALLREEDAESAYKQAGYRGGNAAAGAARLLATPAVREYLAAADVNAGGMEGSRAAAIAQPPEVLQYLTQLLRGETGGERERLKAAELLGKRHGLFSEKPAGGDTPAVMIVDDLDG